MLNEVPSPSPVQVQRANLWTPKYKYKTKKERKLLYFFALLPRLYKSIQWRLGLAFSSKLLTPKQMLFVIFFLFAGLHRVHTLSADQALFFKN
jgi:hypothetical protein